MTEADHAGRRSGQPLRTLARWCRQGLRAAVLMRPDWRGLRSGPGPLLLAVVVCEIVEAVISRAFIVGDASVDWRALPTQLAVAAVLAWACWFAVPPPPEYRDARRHPPDAPTLFTLFYVQGALLVAVLDGALVPAIRSGFLDQPAHRGLAWWFWMAPVFWSVAAMIRLMLGSRAAGLGRRWLACVVVAASSVGAAWLLPNQFWYASSPPTAFQDKRLRLTQETMELQPRLLASALDAIAPQRPGVVDLYAITFAPYASEDVFMRESALVADVMANRFDAQGRTLQLVNNRATETQLPWATPLNLQRAIERVAQRMDKQEDILFIHLTSHGGADGELAAAARPMTVASVTPQALRQWLDDAGIRNRVISISACFSGSWIAPLAGDDTLVMTAADADHTSYGCGSKSTLTFFGQAMYDEQLRHTWSFEEAHAASRKLIDQRERAAGKDDGYSNPQISVGPRIRERLKALEARLAASAAR
ncbi:C13 family peptidase [Scleromatobacter humisilvae]|uniref:C13 family peptidase n=1 Tax=Scleromatobacter humisilvae TaxID=2897159 RepID=A0A9X1YPF2_9BURK|nr:C13 family peptidase [Scleromatobacter humisilvae]MCK9689295.1 C13 family peptidase [Scleromatobacter humisilvae]